MICATCKRPFSDLEIEAKKKQKSDRIKQARIDAKNAGEQVGAKRKYDREAIIKLRNDGLSIRAIAKLIGSSISPVNNAIKESKP